MSFSPLLSELINALRCLPGVGPKSAQRMAFHLLERQREKGLQLADALTKSLSYINHCNQCRNFSEADLCQICNNAKRDQRIVCVVETPIDAIAIEQTHTFRGRYFVLMGHLSPIDGIGPAEIGLNILQQQLQNNLIEELILATNLTVEGEATAHYIAEMAKAQNKKVSRIAHGVPLGGELEYIDSNTLAHAFADRKSY